MSKDKRFKKDLFRFLEEGGLKLRKDVQVGELEVDVIIEKSEDRSDLEGLKPIEDTFSKSGKKILVLEYKSDGDLLRVLHVYKTIGYYYFYLYKEHFELKNYDLSEEDVGILFITTKNPSKVKNTFGYDEIRAGFYLLHTTVPSYLIVINELDINPENYGLLYFSTEGKRMDYLISLVKKEKLTLLETKLISYHRVYDSEEIKMASETANVNVDELGARVRKGLLDYGLDKALDEFNVDEIAEAIKDKEKRKELLRKLQELENKDQ